MICDYNVLLHTKICFFIVIFTNHFTFSLHKKFIAESDMLNDKQNNWSWKLYSYTNHY